MTGLLVRLIKIYQHYLSPDHSAWGRTRHPYGYCRFSPSCSEYAKESLAAHGLIKGVGKAVFRILRCNPFSLPAFDPVTKTK